MNLSEAARRLERCGADEVPRERRDGDGGPPPPVVQWDDVLLKYTDRVTTMLGEHRNVLQTFIDKWAMREEQIIFCALAELTGSSADSSASAVRSDEHYPDFCGPNSTAQPTAQKDSVAVLPQLQGVSRLTVMLPQLQGMHPVKDSKEPFDSYDSQESNVSPLAHPQGIHPVSTMLAKEEEKRAPSFKLHLERTITNRVFQMPSLVAGAVGKRDASLGRVAQVINSSWFDTLCGFVITMNAIVMAYSADYAINNLEQPHTIVIDIVELAFATFYTTELALRIGVDRWNFIFSDGWRWNLFDSLLVASAIYDQVAFFNRTLSGNDDGAGSNFTFVRIVRLMKMLKLLRVVRIMKSFRELRLLMNSIIGSVKSLVWSVVLIFMITYIFGVCFLQGATSFLMQQGAEDKRDAAKLVRYWGSLHDAMLSLYKASTSGDSWTYIAEPLRQVGPEYYLLFLMYVAFFMFVVTNTLTSLFLESTMRNADKDHVMIIQDELSRKNEYISRVKKMYATMDEDGTGEITWEEFSTHLRTPEMVAFASSLDIEVVELTQFFAILSANGTQKVNLETFTIGCMKLRGTAKSMDLLGLIEQHRTFVLEFRDFSRYCHRQFEYIFSAKRLGL